MPPQDLREFRRTREVPSLAPLPMLQAPFVARLPAIGPFLTCVRRGLLDVDLPPPVNELPRLLILSRRWQSQELFTQVQGLLWSRACEVHRCVACVQPFA